MNYLLRCAALSGILLLLPLAGRSQSAAGIVYASEDLTVHQLSSTVYAHVSYLETQDYGRVACNGMLVVSDGEAAIFDTPVDDAATEALLRFLTDSLTAKVVAVVPTHFHDDCIGGIAAVRNDQLPIYLEERTKEKLAVTGDHLAGDLLFADSLHLAVGSDSVTVGHFGAGHTHDNVVVYSRKGNILFGGCLLKAAGAGKGNLADADVAAWPLTVTRVKQRYPDAALIIPGHGQWGGPDLYDYTIKLFTPPADR